jgi:hypothetical protein
LFKAAICVWRQAPSESPYGTARGYLKVIFDKLAVHTQAQLVRRILSDAST